MVSHHLLPGIQVRIRANDAFLQEYSDPRPSADVKCVSRHVESTTGTIFEIVATLQPDRLPQGQVYCMYCYVDGHWASSLFKRYEPGETTLTSRGTFISPNLLKQYQFGSLEHVSTKPDPKARENVGCIEVRMTREKPLHEITVPGQFAEIDLVSNMHGKDAIKKGLNHVIEFAAPISMTKTNSWNCEQVGDTISFKFFYRSKSALEALEIIPPPLPLHEKPASSMSAADIAELQAELRELREERTKMVKVKRELVSEESRPRKKAHIDASTEIIEIGDDDDENAN